MKTQFSHNLKSKRLQFGWSQERVAMEISIKVGKRIDKSTYRSWENGNTSPKLDILVTIVEVFGIDDLYLFISKRVENLRFDNLSTIN